MTVAVLRRVKPVDRVDIGGRGAFWVKFRCQPGIDNGLGEFGADDAAPMVMIWALLDFAARSAE